MVLPDILPAAIIVLVIAAALYTALSWLLARLWCKPRRQTGSKTPADYGLSFETIQFSSHAIPLSGWFIPAESNRAPPLILAHGWGKNAGEMLPLAQLLYKAGFALLLYDGRGHGASGGAGPITILKLAEDIVAGVAYLQTRPDVDKRRLGILGRSIGGSAAIVAASMEPRIQALVSCSAFADPKALTRDFLAMMHVPVWLFAWPVFQFIECWLGTSMDDVAPQNRIERIAVPLLLIHGAADTFIQPSNLEALYARAHRDRTQQLLIPGRGHSDLLRDPGCTQQIVMFFSKNLLNGVHQTDLLTSAPSQKIEANRSHAGYPAGLKPTRRRQSQTI